MAITDYESAKAWLEGQPQNVIIGVAARSALRAVPGLCTPQSANQGIALAVLRARLTACVAALYPNHEVNLAARSAASSTHAAVRFARNASVAGADAADAAETLFGADSAAGSAGVLSHTVSIARTSAENFANLSRYDEQTSYALVPVERAARSATYSAFNVDTIRADGSNINSSLFTATLWPGGGVPDFFAEPYQALKAFWAQDQAVWGFWARWYDGMLNGTPMDWALQEAVVLIEQEVWEEGAEAVAREIEKIEAKFDLLDETQKFKSQSEAQINRLGIGGNNPPVEIDDPTIISEITVIWDVINDLEDEVQKEAPRKAKIEKLVELLSAALKSVLLFCGRLGEHAAKVVVSLGVTAAGAKFFEPELLEAVIEAAKRFLSSGAAG